MQRSTPDERRRLGRLTVEELRRRQLGRLGELWSGGLAQNAFYARKLGSRSAPSTWQALQDLPFTHKQELVRPHSRFSANLSFEPGRYVRYHQTSGTSGQPLAVLDTADDWQWWLECWQYVLDAADVTAGDRALMAFSFGPFVGFWSASDALLERGCMLLSGGGLTTLARLELARAAEATILCCTPSYALHLTEVGSARGMDVAALAIRKIILAGEPGGSLPAVRQRLARAWGAEILDHAGASEVGPWGFGDREGRGLHVIETEFIAEFITPAGEEPAQEGDVAELVLTTLGRVGCPVIRYRTGDLVRWVRDPLLECRFVLLDGGVLGRADEMRIVRGVNVFPSALDEILRSFPDVVEYQARIDRVAQMDQLTVEVEGPPDAAAIVEKLHVALGLKTVVNCVASGTLPRFEGKGRRLVDQREQP